MGLAHPTDRVCGGSGGAVCSRFYLTPVLVEFDAGKSEGGVGSGDRGQAVGEGKIPG